MASRTDSPTIDGEQMKSRNKRKHWELYFCFLLHSKLKPRWVIASSKTNAMPIPVSCRFFVHGQMFLALNHSWASIIGKPRPWDTQQQNISASSPKYKCIFFLYQRAEQLNERENIREPRSQLSREEKEEETFLDRVMNDEPRVYMCCWWKKTLMRNNNSSTCRIHV